MKNVLITTANGYVMPITTAIFVNEVTRTLFELRWMEMAVIFLILIDFVYGVAASVGKRKEEFHFSRAGRRTTCKFLEYNGYLAGGMVFGMAVFEPLAICSHVTAAACGLLLAILYETDSITEHFCDVHGIRQRFSLKKALVAYLRRRFRDMDQAIRDAETKEPENKKEE